MGFARRDILDGGVRARHRSTQSPPFDTGMSNATGSVDRAPFDWGAFNWVNRETFTHPRRTRSGFRWSERMVALVVIFFLAAITIIIRLFVWLYL
jgi:hypothetical protein